jgi:serine O-acetyltransferase
MPPVEMELTAPEMGFRALVWSDYRRVNPAEPTRRAVLAFLPRLLFNPSLQFAMLVRIAQKGPRLLWHPVRWMQVVMFSCEIYTFKGPGAIELGPAISFPHPQGIIIGPGTRVGTGVTIYNNTQIGSNRHWTLGDPVDKMPALGDRSIVYAYSALQGRWDVGHDAVVGSWVILDEHVPPGALKTRKSLKVRGEWAGDSREL